MPGDNGTRRLELFVPAHVKVEIGRLRIMMEKRSMGNVLELLLDIYHSTPHGDPQLWKAIKATTNSNPGREIDGKG